MAETEPPKMTGKSGKKRRLSDYGEGVVVGEEGRAFVQGGLWESGGGMVRSDNERREIPDPCSRSGLQRRGERCRSR